MQTFAQSLIALVLSGEVEREVAANAATNRHDFLVDLERAEKEARALERERAAQEAGSTVAEGGGSEPPTIGGGALPLAAGLR
jgi:ABC-type transporter Mla MlaB component